MSGQQPRFAAGAKVLVPDPQAPGKLLSGTVQSSVPEIGLGYSYVVATAHDRVLFVAEQDVRPASAARRGSEPPGGY